MLLNCPRCAVTCNHDAPNRFVGIAAFGLRRWFREAHGQTPLTFWLVGGAITVALLFIVLGTAGVLYGFIRYGAS